MTNEKRVPAYWVVKNAKGEYWSDQDAMFGSRYRASQYHLGNDVYRVGGHAIPVYLTITKRKRAPKQHDFGWALRMVRKGVAVRRVSLTGMTPFSNENDLAFVSPTGIRATDWVKA